MKGRIISIILTVSMTLSMGGFTPAGRQYQQDMESAAKEYSLVVSGEPGADETLDVSEPTPEATPEVAPETTELPEEEETTGEEEEPEEIGGAVAAVQALIDALSALEDMDGEELAAAREQLGAAYEAYKTLSDAQRAQLTDADVMKKMYDVEKRMDALPALEEVQAMDMDAQGEAYLLAQDAYEAYMELTEEQQALIGGLDAVYALFGFFNGQIMPLADDSWSGSGTEEEPYLIMDAEGLRLLAEKVNDGNNYEGKYFRLENDIDLSASEPWTAIGTYFYDSTSTLNNNPFSGTFDGGGYEIKGLSIKKSDNNQGLFGYVDIGGIVKNLTVSGSVTGSSLVGGVVGRNYGTVENCVNNAAVTGSGGYVGGIVGYNNGSGCTVANCTNTGTVTGDRQVGGVVGYNYSDATVTNCFNTATVSGRSSVGGVVGNNESYSDVENCYNTGEVTGIGNSENIGGVVGRNYSLSSVTNCYYLEGTAGIGIAEAAGTVNSATAKTAAQFESGEVARLLQDGQAAESGQVWGQKIGEDTYPVLSDDGSIKVYRVTFKGSYNEAYAYANSGGTVELPDSVTVGNTYTVATTWQTQLDGGEPFNAATPVTGDVTVYPGGGTKLIFAGDGTPGSPYEIPDRAIMEAFRDYVNAGEDTKGKHFKLTADIDLDGSNSNQWTPIGKESSSSRFDGTFDGNSKTISGLHINYYNVETTKYQGLFGYSTGTIKNLTVSGTVTAYKYVGGVVGQNDGTVANCSNIGTISSYLNFVGGVVGWNEGTVENCSNTGSVSASTNQTINGDEVGGVVGGNSSSGTIRNCYNTGTVTGSQYVGGVVGSNGGTVENCYNTGAVRDVWHVVGGIVGSNDGTVVNCYFKKTNQINASLGAIGGGTTSGDNITNVEAKNETAFTAGEVAWLLQDGQAEGSGQAWGQTLTGSDVDDHPVLTGDAAKKVLKVTFMAFMADSSEGVYDVKYTNPDGTVPLPDDPSREGYALFEWRRQDDETTFDESTTVTKDITVTAVWQEKYGGKDAQDTVITITYGQGAAQNLDEWMSYATGTSAAGNFTYEIESGNDGLGATLGSDGKTLTIPANAKADEYELSITAHELEPKLSAYSISYGASDVTLTVTVTVNKADSSVAAAPQANSLTYTGSAQPLVTAGTANGGIMQYRLGDTGDFTDTIPTAIDADDYTVYYRVKGDENHNDTEHETVKGITITIDKATPVVKVEAIPGLAYSKSPQVLVTGSTTGGTLKYKLDDGGYDTEVPMASDPGTYKVYYKVEGNSNYNDVEEAEPVTVTIAKADLAAGMFDFTPPDDLTYDGGVKYANVHVKSDIPDIEDHHITLKYYKDGETAGTAEAPAEPGTYTVKIDVSGNGFYNDVANLEVGSFTIVYLPAPENPYTISVSGETYQDKDGNVYWLKDSDEASITPAVGYTISAQPGGTSWETALTVNAWTSGSKIYLRDAQGHMTDGIAVTETIKADDKAPEGTITLNDRTLWQSFLNAISFGFFYKDAQTAIVTADDADGSGVAGIQYYLASEGMDKEEVIKISGWQSYESSIGLAKAGKYVIYAKITDNLDHVTYISSNGIVIYSDAEAVTTEILYTKTTKVDKKASVELGGNTIHEIKCGDKVLEPDTEYTVEDGTITFQSDWLDSLTAGEYALTIFYNPQGVEYGADAEGDKPNTTTITLTVGKEDQAALTIDNPGTVTYGDAFTLTATGGSGTGEVTWKVESGNAEIDANGKLTITGVGEVKITATKEADDNYNAMSAAITFTVSPKSFSSPTVTVTLAEGPFVYNGSAHTPAVTVTDGGTSLAASIDYTVEYSDNTDAGTNTAKVTVSGKGNYDGKIEKTFTIDPATVSFSVTDNSHTYDGKNKTATVTQTEDETPSVGGSFTVKYRQGNMNVTPNAAGAYEVWVTITSSNFKFADGSAAAKVGELTVVPAKPAIVTSPTAAAITYGQSLEESTLSDWTVQNPITGDEVKGTFAWADGGTTYPAAADSGVRAYKVIFTPEDADNYTTAETTVTLIVNKAALTPILASVESKTYDGNTGATGTVKLEGAKFGQQPTATGTFSFVDKNVGDNKAVNVTGITLGSGWDANYRLVVTTLDNQPTTAAITPLTASIAWNEPLDFAYDGKPHGVTAEVGNAIEGDEFTLEYTGNTGTDVGQYKAEVTALGNDNYTLDGAKNVTQIWEIYVAGQPAPIVLINYIDEVLVGTDGTMEFADEPDGEWMPCKENMSVVDYGWDAVENTVYIRCAADDYHLPGEVLELFIPGRPDAPTDKIVVTKSGTTITITNTDNHENLEYSLDEENWNGDGVFTDLIPGKEYELSVRTKAMDPVFDMGIMMLAATTAAETKGAFASYSKTKIVITVEEDGSTTLMPDETVETENGGITNNGDEIVFTDEDGNTGTAITPPEGEDFSDGVDVDGDGNVTVPDGSTVHPGNGGPDITVGPGNEGTVDEDGNVTLPGGGSAQVGDSTVTVPEDGDTITPNEDGTVDMPGGSTVHPGNGGPDITMGDEGGSYDPETGQVIFYYYNVTIDKQDGSDAITVKVAYNTPLAKPDDPTREGYTFGGWYTEAACTTAYDFTTPVTGPLTIYAKWTENTAPTPVPAESPASTGTPSPRPMDGPIASPGTTPNTGDGNLLWPWILLMAFSFAELVIIAVFRYRNKKRNSL